MKIITLIFALFSFCSSANETEISLGLGYTYGSPILGVQFATRTEMYKAYVSAGLVGFSTGLEIPISQNKRHTVGVSWGTELLTSDEGFGVITYSYHFDSFVNNGFVAGVGVGYRREEIGYDDESGNWVTLGGIDTSPTLTFILGYKF